MKFYILLAYLAALRSLLSVFSNPHFISISSIISLLFSLTAVHISKSFSDIGNLYYLTPRGKKKEKVIMRHKGLKSYDNGKHEKPSSDYESFVP